MSGNTPEFPGNSVTLRTRLERAICSADGVGRCRCEMYGNPKICALPAAQTDAVLAVLRNPSDADVERVARGMAAHNEAADWTQWLGEARAAIRALVGDGGR